MDLKKYNTTSLINAEMEKKLGEYSHAIQQMIDDVDKQEKEFLEAGNFCNWKKHSMANIAGFKELRGAFSTAHQKLQELKKSLDDYQDNLKSNTTYAEYWYYHRFDYLDRY